MAQDNISKIIDNKAVLAVMFTLAVLFLIGIFSIKTSVKIIDVGSFIEASLTDSVFKESVVKTTSSNFLVDGFFSGEYNKRVWVERTTYKIDYVGELSGDSLCIESFDGSNYICKRIIK